MDYCMGLVSKVLSLKRLMSSWSIVVRFALMSFSSLVLSDIGVTVRPCSRCSTWESQALVEVIWGLLCTCPLWAPWPSSLLVEAVSRQECRSSSPLSEITLLYWCNCGSSLMPLSPLDWRCSCCPAYSTISPLECETSSWWPSLVKCRSVKCHFFQLFCHIHIYWNLEPLHYCYQVINLCHIHH